ncbi:MAG: radical SAM protein [Elusimicrobia bacterium]|nr:radical SAM protein [Elusimicrobiota bacterium]
MAVVLPRVLEVEAGCPEFERGLRLFLALPSRRLRLELEGFQPGWLKPLEIAAGWDKDLDIVLRDCPSLPRAAAQKLALLGARSLLSVRHAGAWARLEGLGLRPAVELPSSNLVTPHLSRELSEVSPNMRMRFGFRPDERLLRSCAGLEVINFWEEDEPPLLASNLRLTAAGKVGWATALRLGHLWPQLAHAAPPVPLARLKSLRGLFMAPAARQAWASRLLRGAARSRWLAAVSAGLHRHDFFAKPCPGFRDGSENKSLRRGIIGAGLAVQDRFLRSRLPEIKSVFLFLRSGCVNDCVFCRHKDDEPGRPLGEIRRFLAGGARTRRSRIALVGNEPLRHPRIAGILRLCRKAGFRDVEVMTSGTLLADLALARALQEAGATAFAIPLYGTTPDTHDAVSGRAGSFARTVQGLENLRRLGLAAFIHTNLMKATLPHLAGLEKLAAGEWGLPFAILPLRPKDPSSMNRPYAELEPSYAELLRGGAGLRCLAGLPVCVQRRIRGSGPEGRLADGMRLYLLHQSFVKPESCAGCPWSASCLGTFREHLKLHPRDLSLLRY